MGRIAAHLTADHGMEIELQFGALLRFGIFPGDAADLLGIEIHGAIQPVARAAFAGEGLLEVEQRLIA